MKISSTYVYRFLNDTKLRELYFDDHMENHFKNNPGLDRLKIEDLGYYFYESNLVINNVTNVKKYVITTTALNICKRIKINEERKFDYLNKLRDGSYMFIISNDEFLKFDKHNNNRIVVANYIHNNNNSRYCMFNITLDNCTEQIPDDDMGIRAYTLFL